MSSILETENIFTEAAQGLVTGDKINPAVSGKVVSKADTKNKIGKREKFMLKGALKRSGFDWWRFVTNGVSRSTGEERTFFIEFYVVNPSLSPEKLSFSKPIPPQLSDEELQEMLLKGEQIVQETNTVPSFVMVKVGQYNHKGKQINGFFPTAKMELGKNDFILKVGDDPRTACTLGSDFTQGVVQVTRTIQKQHPEYESSVGTMGWNLKFDKKVTFDTDFKGKKNSWCILGDKNTCSGSIVFDGEEFVVNREKSTGYYDKYYGKAFSVPYFHLNSTSFISQITGKPLYDANLIVHGIFEDRLSVFVNLDGEHISFNASEGKKFDLKYDCVEVPSDGENVKLHWIISISDKNNVLDIDIFCNTKGMFLRNYDCVEGKNHVMKILTGANGTGEVRLYHKVKKNLELIEHAKIADALCEYGNIEDGTEE